MGSNSIPPKTLSDESINRGLVCAHMHFIARTQKMGEQKHTQHQHVHPRRRNVTTLMVGLKNGHIRKNLTQSGEPQRYSWGTQKKKKTTTKKKPTSFILLYVRSVQTLPWCEGPCHCKLVLLWGLQNSTDHTAVIWEQRVQTGWMVVRVSKPLSSFYLNSWTWTWAMWGL